MAPDGNPGGARLAARAPVAQGIERAPPEREVAGSIPAGRNARGKPCFPREPPSFRSSRHRPARASRPARPASGHDRSAWNDRPVPQFIPGRELASSPGGPGRIEGSARPVRSISVVVAVVVPALSDRLDFAVGAKEVRADCYASRWLSTGHSSRHGRRGRSHTKTVPPCSSFSSSTPLSILAAARQPVKSPLGSP